MRESFGGAFIINLLLVFIVIFISFMAVTISYAKAFRVKNQVINIVEQNQYSGTGDSYVEGLINDYLEIVPYYVDGIECGAGSANVRGACIKPMIESADPTQPISEQYYKITTYIQINFPFFDIKLTIPISGETKMIYTS